MSPRTLSPYEACERLFRDYPLAGDVTGMTVTVPDDSPRFYSVSRDEDQSFFLFEWKTGNGPLQEVAPETRSLQGEFKSVLTSGIPVPRDGSLFGAVDGRKVTCLIQIMNRFEGTRSPHPGFSVAPLAGTPQEEWPEFARELTFGRWFWQAYRAGRIVDLAPHLSGVSGAMYYSASAAAAEVGGLLAVPAPLAPANEPWILPAGVFAYFGALRSGKHIASLSEVLGDPGKIDVGLRFFASARRPL